MPNPTDDTIRAALAAIEHDYPRWQCSLGTLPHLFYARVPNSSPPIVVRGATPGDLRDRVTVRGWRGSYGDDRRVAQGQLQQPERQLRAEIATATAPAGGGLDDLRAAWPGWSRSGGATTPGRVLGHSRPVAVNWWRPPPPEALAALLAAR